MANDLAQHLWDTACALNRARAGQDIDIGFLKRPAPLAGVADAVNEMSAELRRAEAEAKKKEEARFDAHLRDYVTNSRHYMFGGFSNAVSCLATLAERLADEQEEFSEADADYRFAMQVLQAASGACDLAYGDRSSKKERQERLAELVKAVSELRP